MSDRAARRPRVSAGNRLLKFEPGAEMFGKYSLFWYLLLLVAVIAVHIVLRQIRRRAQQYDPRSNDFDLLDLQRLLASGQMTSEEYEKARAVILSRSEATFGPAKGFPVLAPPEQRGGKG